MKKVLLSFIGLTLCWSAIAQTDILDARSYGIGQTVTVTGIASNGAELGAIRYMQDLSGGIAAYGSSLSGVARYDSITVTGEISEFSGLLEVAPITNVVNHGPAIVVPMPAQVPITSVDETWESELIEIQNVTFIETGNFSGNSTYTITDGANNLDVRINTGIDLVGTAIPTGPITITGMTGQFNANYQIVPRDLNDIIAYVAPAEEINVMLEGSTVLDGSNYFIGNATVIDVTIQNSGISDLTITGHSFSGVDMGDFSSDIVAGIVAGGSSQAYTISFSPVGNGSKFASIEIGSNDSDENPYIINFEGVGTDNLATEPTANPTGLTFPIVEAYTLGGQYTAGLGADNYLVLWKVGSMITGVPADGTTYLRGDAIGDATVAYVGAGTAFTPRGIVANQEYYFAIYAFNGQGGFENYLTAGPVTGSASSLGANIGAYYNGIDINSGTLSNDLNSLINPHTFISYFLYKQTLMQEFEVRDTTNGKSVITCAYSGEKMIFDDPFDWTATGYSREHTFAHSWMATWPADSPEQPEYTDQHNLYPANLQEANIPRSNLPLGEITGAVLDTYLEGNVGESIPGGQLVYEPREAQKGNAARAIFYMSTAYNFPLNGNVNSSKQNQDLLKSWHFADLPDNYEIARHEYIFDLQENRNPFIDSVEFVCYLDFDDNAHIGNPTDCSLSIDDIIQMNTIVFPVPSQDKVFIQVNSQNITGYELMDMQGRLVKSDFDMNTSKLTLTANDLQSGVYLIRIITPNGQSLAKIMMQ